MNTLKNQMMKSGTPSVLKRFFSQGTVEGQYVLSKFTKEMITEILAFEADFSKEDTQRVISSTNPKECLYTVASVISRIRGEKSLEDIITTHKIRTISKNH